MSGMYVSQVEQDETDPVMRYLREIKRHEQLTPDQEIMLAKRIEDGDRDAYEMMANANLQLVVHVAKRYLGRGLDLMDLTQEGNIGLMCAIEKYDWRLGYRFSTHAFQWIRQAISRATQDKGRTIRLPSYTFKLRAQVRRFSMAFFQEKHRQPTDNEIVTGCPDITSVGQLWDVMMPDTISLDGPAFTGNGPHDDGEELTVGDIVPDVAAIEVTERAEMLPILREIVGEMLGVLNEQEKDVIMYRFGWDVGQQLNDIRWHTLEETGRRMGFTRERARQIEEAVITKIKYGYLVKHPELRTDLGFDAPLPSFIKRKVAA